ncbi:hypothetical protein [Tardiphaga sp. OK245]|uniref:hypothetical protein n=1 Tax=Tardiphaga sp. OK245 TaxID=1855306 RepID=UPI0008A7AB76|nr:hypothetical protein [Tardiphaga sp. OK245]SEH96917.1 hypothetical protein SAMN05216367_2597 [Tardiphaga sp. OK245]
MTDASTDIFHMRPCHAPKGRGPTGLWALAALALAISLALPFLLVDVPPVLDYPNHLARYFVLAHPDDSVLSQMVMTRWRILPNLGMDVLGAGLLRITPVHVGGRLLLALSLFAPIIGVVVYHRAAFGRFSYWPLASGIVAYNGIFLLGFMNFLLSVGVALIAAAAWLALRRRGGTWTVALAGALSAALIFFCHLYGVVFFALLIGSRELAVLQQHRRWNSLRLRMVGGAVVLVALTLLPALILYIMSPLAEGGAAAGDWKLINKIWGIFTPFMTSHVALTLASGLMVFVFVILNWRQAVVAPGVVLVLAALGIVYVVMPSSIKGGTFADVRLALIMGLTLFAGVQPRFTKRAGLLASVSVALVIAVRVGSVSADWAAHSDDLADLRAAIAPVMPGDRVLVAHQQHGSNTRVEKAERALPGFYRLDDHISALLLIERRAFWPQLFADPAQQPIDIKSPFDSMANPLMAPALWSSLQADQAPVMERYLQNWRADFDHVLLIDPPRPVMPPAGLAPAVTTDYTILYRIDAVDRYDRSPDAVKRP